jgi:hypothetical protein
MRRLRFVRLARKQYQENGIGLISPHWFGLKMVAVWPSVIHHLIHLEYAVGGGGWMPSIFAPRRCVNASSPYSANELMRPSGDYNKRISTGTAARDPVKGRACTTSRRISIERSCSSVSSEETAAAPPASPADSMANSRL